MCIRDRLCQEPAPFRGMLKLHRQLQLKLLKEFSHRLQSLLQQLLLFDLTVAWINCLQACKVLRLSVTKHSLWILQNQTES